MVSPFKVVLVIVIIIIPVYSFIVFERNDISNTFPTLDSTINIQGNNSTLYIHDIPSLTFVKLNLSKFLEIANDIEVFLLSKYNLNFLNSDPKSNFVKGIFYANSTNFSLSGYFNNYAELYVVIRANEPDVLINAKFGLHMEFEYENFLVREAVTIFVNFGFYVIGLYIVSSKWDSFLQYRAIARYERKKRDDDQKFLRKLQEE